MGKRCLIPFLIVQEEMLHGSARTWAVSHAGAGPGSGQQGCQVHGHWVLTASLVFEQPWNLPESCCLGQVLGFPSLGLTIMCPAKEWETVLKKVGTQKLGPRTLALGVVRGT